MEIPNQRKKLRACMLCGLVKTETQFKTTGCENCESLLNLRGNGQNVVECTSETFYGLVALMEPSKSWVARWQRCDKFERGMYAVKIMGQLPDHVLNVLDANNIHYTPRDGSQED